MLHLTRSAVNVFAVLDTFSSGSDDILDSLAPFFEPALLARRGEVFDPEIIAQDIRNSYKWNFTSDVAEEFIPRLVARGWIKQDANCSYNIVISQREETESENESLQKFDSVAHKFREFSKELSPLTVLNTNDDHYKEILIEWLLYVDAYSEANLQISVETRKDENGTLTQRSNIPNTTSLTPDEMYLCARFVESAIQKDEDISKVLCKVASIGLITEVVQDFYRPTSKVNKSDLVVFLDAPIALEYLGVSGKAAKENIEPIVSELQNIGVQVRVFKQSLLEMTKNLRAVLAESNPTGPTAKAMARGDVLRAFVQDVAKDPEHYLKNNNISVVQRSLDQYPHEHDFFTPNNYSDLYGALNFMHKPSAREHDATVASLIMRQGGGRGSGDIFQSKFLLLTRNGPFAQRARKECVKMDILAQNHVSPVVHRRVLATAVWLRTGLGTNKDQIPKRLLLASCERVLALSESVVKKVEALSTSLGTEQQQQLALLLSKDRSAQMLMDRTLGVSRVITEENLPELLDDMLRPHLEDERNKGEEKLKEAKREASKKIDAERHKVDKEVEKRRSAEQALRLQKGEDMDALGQLCKDVSGSLRKRKRFKQGIGFTLALSLISPIFLELSPMVTWATFIFGVLLAYLTLIGSYVIRVGHTPEQALKMLNKTACGRALSIKLSRFDATWEGADFKLQDRTDDNSPPDKLL